MTMPMVTTEQVEAFMLVFLRVSALIATVPILGDRSVPARVKAGLSFLVAALLYPVVPMPTAGACEDVFALFLRMTGEVMIGAVIGMIARLIFAGIQLAGQLIGFQMGFAIVNVIDPAFSLQVSIIAQFQYLIALLLFLSLNGHHMFLYAVAESFRILPPLAFHFSGGLMQAITGFVRDMFEIGIKVGAPIIAILFFMSVGLGLVARTVPQINIFIVGFPLQIAIGLIGVGVTMPYFVGMIEKYIIQMEREITVVLSLM
ncbi:MAG: flagellar biosynthetic protein FliR [Syntrophales bacterium]|nr:flagellar biosynthetic protein FliR [Syntrophales bacterium]MDD5231825.1 flagellar biosynthetic protein FliR [Syntrophales bacterium]